MVSSSFLDDLCKILLKIKEICNSQYWMIKDVLYSGRDAMFSDNRNLTAIRHRASDLCQAVELTSTVCSKFELITQRLWQSFMRSWRVGEYYTRRRARGQDDVKSPARKKPVTASRVYWRAFNIISDSLYHCYKWLWTLWQRIEWIRTRGLQNLSGDGLNLQILVESEHIFGLSQTLSII